MVRLFTYIALVGALVGGAVWLADRPGEVVIRWQGWRIDTTVPVLALILLAAMASTGTLLRFAGLVLGAPGRFLAARRARRTREGYRALSDGLAAVAAGDRQQAKALAKRADTLLHDPTLTRLLTARAADLAGEKDQARRSLEEMAAEPKTALAGHKGLMEMARAEGDHAGALDHARRAFAINPAADGLALALFELKARAGRWAEAIAALDIARKRKALKAAEAGRLEAMALAERARQAEMAGDSSAALDLALKAHGADAALAPAAALAARLLALSGKERKAVGILEKAWKIAPHPLLISAWADLHPQEPALERVKRMERLAALSPKAPEGHLALAEAALAARLWGKARSHLETIIQSHPVAAAFTLLARLEQDERQDEAAAARWLAEAAKAPADPSWVCPSCQARLSDWSAICPACGAPGPLVWR